ncbi:TPA: hypothetical protein HA244_06135 [Candidatus Micrarchaeota archaeon]|nr:hypothetical protein [Candidatus Micrarchaeota archaeon]
MPVREALKRILNEDVEAKVIHASEPTIEEPKATWVRGIVDSALGNRVGSMDVQIRMSPALHNRLPQILHDIAEEQDFQNNAIRIYRVGDKQKNSVTQIRVTAEANPTDETKKMLDDAYSFLTRDKHHSLTRFFRAVVGGKVKIASLKEMEGNSFGVDLETDDEGRKIIANDISEIPKHLGVSVVANTIPDPNRDIKVTVLQVKPVDSSTSAIEQVEKAREWLSTIKNWRGKKNISSSQSN